jgi:tRNA(fMet)-specific endonuclease VapC
MYVIDTDVLSIVQRGGTPQADRAFARIEAVERDVYVTIVSFEEQMRGWLAYIAHAHAAHRQVEGYARLYELIEDFSLRQILQFTDGSFRRLQSLRRTHRRTGVMDLKIAAIAMENDATLVTRNVADFRRIEGLRVEDWTL